MLATIYRVHLKFYLEFINYLCLLRYKNLLKRQCIVSFEGLGWNETNLLTKISVRKCMQVKIYLLNESHFTLYIGYTFYSNLVSSKFNANFISQNQKSLNQNFYFVSLESIFQRYSINILISYKYIIKLYIYYISYYLQEC